MTEKLAGLLQQAARASSNLYERTTRRIFNETEQSFVDPGSHYFSASWGGIQWEKQVRNSTQIHRSNGIQWHLVFLLHPLSFCSTL
ncbi:hypothetical protein ACFXTH_003329 [Malus domestica]